MLNSKGFDLWADNYDETVGISDNDNTYPFAGYKKILNEIYNYVLESSSKNILFKGDFSKDLVKELKQQKYDAIIATYSLHHLTDRDKIEFIKKLIGLLNENAVIYIGDVAFNTRRDLEKCKEQCGEHWDNEEIYFVYDEIKREFPNSEFIKYSECAGIIKIW